MAYNPNLYTQYGQQSFPMPVPQVQQAPLVPQAPLVSQAPMVPQVQQYQPQLAQMVQPQQQALNGNLVIEVYGRDGAEALPLGPNTKIIVYDKTKNIMYNIQTDDAANKNIQEFDFFPRAKRDEAHNREGYVTTEQFDALVKRVDEMETKPTRTTARKAAQNGE